MKHVKEMKPIPELEGMVKEIYSQNGIEIRQGKGDDGIKPSKNTYQKLEKVEKLLIQVNRILNEVEKENGLEDFESRNPSRQGWSFNQSCDRWNYTFSEAVLILCQMMKEKQDRENPK